jgi:hypothetical protein
VISAEARPGFRLAGWQDNGNSASFETTLNGDAAFHALFERDEAGAPLAALGVFRFDQWAGGTPASDQPPYIRFEQSGAGKPESGALMDSVWSGSYNLTDRSRFVGLGADGIGLKDTGRLADFPGGGIPGSVALLLDTRGASAVTVAFTAATIAPGENPYALRLQVAVGNGEFADLLDASGQPVVYVSESTPGETRFPPVSFPAAAIGQEHVELRWRYHATGAYTGSGPMLRLDDILISAQNGIGTLTGPGKITRLEWLLPAGNLSVHFRGSASLRHTLQWSDDLQAWSDGDTFTTDPDGSAILEVFRPADDSSVRYLRVKRSQEQE